MTFQCPHCSRPITGNEAFCPNCGGRLTLSAASPPTGWTADQNAHVAAPPRNGLARPIIIVGLLILVAAVAAYAYSRMAVQGILDDVGRAVATPTPYVPLPTDEPLAPDPGAGGETQTYKVGEVIHLESEGSAWADLTVTKPSIHKSYDTYNTPQVKGNVFIQAWVTYKAVANGVSYNPFDWQAFAADKAVESWYGPEPALGSGTLSKGRTASGWLVYEVPATGRVVLSYGGPFSNDAPIFEVVIRE